MSEFNQISEKIIEEKIDIDKLLKVVIEYKVMEKHYIKYTSKGKQSFGTRKNDKIIEKINLSLSELKKYLLDFINVNKILEKELNSIIDDNKKNEIPVDNWREEMLIEHKNKCIKEKELNLIQNKINLIKKKLLKQTNALLIMKEI